MGSETCHFMFGGSVLGPNYTLNYREKTIEPVQPTGGVHAFLGYQKTTIIFGPIVSELVVYA